MIPSPPIEPPPAQAPPAQARPAKTGPAQPRRAGDSPDRVYAALRLEIIEHALLAGTRLPEGDIASRFGVSRTVVRAALARLIAEGLVVRPNNLAARVARPSEDEAADILDLRQSIELLVLARLTKRRLAPAMLAALRAHVAEEERALADGEAGHAASVRLSGEFHVRLAEAAGSPLLARYVAELVSRCSLLLSGQRARHSGHCGVQDHRALLDRLESGDRAGALSAMRDHLEAVADRALTAQGTDGQAASAA
ncbi:GntR family transcriptional regulator [Acidisoma sp. C75]